MVAGCPGVLELAGRCISRQDGRAVQLPNDFELFWAVEPLRLFSVPLLHVFEL